MLSQKWTVGLEIQNYYFTAVALQQQKTHWLLKGWWYIPLDGPIYNQHNLLAPNAIISQLCLWRTLLPKSISLRTILPCHQVLQQHIKLPDTSLSSHELEWFVENAINKLFPLPPQELMLDHQIDISSPEAKLLITAAKRNTINQWIHVFTQASLPLNVIDIAPCVLRTLARRSSVIETSLLVHKLENYLLIVSPLRDPFYFELLPCDNSANTYNYHLLLQHYHQATGLHAEAISISGCAIPLEPHDNIHYWSPFKAITNLTMALPQTPSLFTLACGLALREDDHD